MDWLSHDNHTENKDQEIVGMSINVRAINTSVNIPVCMSIGNIQAVKHAHEDTHLQELKGIYNTGLTTQERRSGA